MRRFARTVLMIALCLIAGGVSLCVCAESAGQILTVSVVAQPDALIEPGEVTLRFTVENPSEYDVENISLSSADGLDSEPVGRVAAGGAESFTRAHKVTRDELDAGEIRFILSHDDPINPDIKVNYGIRAVLNRADTRISAALIRRFSTTTPAVGGEITAAYRVRNTGNVPLTQLRVQDSLGNFSGRVERLEPNGSALLVSRVTVTEPTASHAALLYCAESTGDETYTLELEDVPIEIAAPDIELRFSAVPAAFSADTAQVVLILTNTGSADYENIAVTDDLYGGVLAENLRLPSGGEPVEVERAYAMRGDGGYRWRVTGRCADGSTLDTVTETVKLPQTEKTPARLTIAAETNLPRIRRAGDVRVKVRLENVGGTDLKNVTVADKERGNLYTFAVLPAENSVEREFVFHVDDDTAFNLSVRAETDGGTANASADNGTASTSENGGTVSTSENGEITSTSENGETGSTSENGGITSASENGGITSTSENGGITSASENGEITSTSENGGTAGASENGGITSTSENGEISGASENGGIKVASTDGGIVYAEADEVRVTIASDGALPEGAGAKLIEFSGGSIKIGGSSTFAVLLITGAAALLVLVILLAAASRRARFEKRVRLAVEKRSRTGSGKGRLK